MFYCDKNIQNKITRKVEKELPQKYSTPILSTLKKRQMQKRNKNPLNRILWIIFRILFTTVM